MGERVDCSFLTHNICDTQHKAKLFYSSYMYMKILFRLPPRRLCCSQALHVLQTKSQLHEDTVSTYLYMYIPCEKMEQQLYICILRKWNRTPHTTAIQQNGNMKFLLAPIVCTCTCSTQTTCTCIPELLTVN